MKVRAASMLALLFAAGCGLALAHGAPNSLVKLDFMGNTVRAEVLVPESELAHATAAERASEPFAEYLLRHLSAETPQGAAWKVEVRSVSNVTVVAVSISYSRMSPSPPGNSPCPPLPCRSAYLRIRTGR